MKNYICGTQYSDPDYIKSYKDRNFQNKYISKNYPEVTLLATFKLHTLEELCHPMCFLVLGIEPRTLYMLEHGLEHGLVSSSNLTACKMFNMSKGSKVSIQKRKSQILSFIFK